MMGSKIRDLFEMYKLYKWLTDEEYRARKGKRITPDEGTKNSDEGHSIEEIIDENKNKAENEEICTCKGHLVCTRAMEELENIHISINGEELIIVGEDPEINKSNITLTGKFGDCKDGYLCDVTESSIEGGVWQNIDEDRSQGEGKEVIKLEDSYMICINGGGMIYFKDSGQNGKDYEGSAEFFADEIGDTKIYVTLKQMIDFGWNSMAEKSLKESVKELNQALNEFGITDKGSIALFMATCGHESGLGSKTTEDGDEEYFIKNGYTSETRGAGYIQVTRDDQLLFYNAIGVKEKDIPANRTEDIAGNYAWMASAWYWSENIRGEGVLLNDYVKNYGSEEGVFLVTQYFVNRYLDKDVYPHFNSDMRDIRRGEAEFSYTMRIEKDENGKEIKIEKIKVTRGEEYSREYIAPKNYDDRREKYNAAVKIWLEGYN